MTDRRLRTLAWAAVAVVLALTFAAYFAPELMLDVANQLWLCVQ